MTMESDLHFPFYEHVKKWSKLRPSFTGQKEETLGNSLKKIKYKNKPRYLFLGTCVRYNLK